MIREYMGLSPRVHPEAHLDESALLIGEVEVASGASVWPGAVLRGDMGPIFVGRNSSVQDNCVCHCTRGVSETRIGENVSVGHGAVLHGCAIGNNCVIGMNAVVMDNAEIGEWSIVAAGAVVTQGKKFPPKSIIAGVPAKLAKQADEKSLAYIEWNAREYIEAVENYGRD